MRILTRLVAVAVAIVFCGGGSLDCILIGSQLDGGSLDSGVLQPDAGGGSIFDTARADFNAESACVGGTGNISAWANDGTEGSALDMSQGNSLYEPACAGSAGSYYVDFNSSELDHMTSGAITAETTVKTYCAVAGQKTVKTGRRYISDTTVAAQQQPFLELDNSASGYRINTGTYLASGVVETVGSYDIVCWCPNGSSSRIVVNGTSVTGNSGTTSSGFSQIYMARRRTTLALNADMRLKRWLMWEGDVMDDAYDALVAEYGAPPVVF